MKKYQVLIASYLLFTLTLPAQNKYTLSIYDENSNDISYYSLANHVGELTIENLNGETVIENIYISNDNVIFHNLDFNAFHSDENVIDTKTDGFHNLYKLIFNNDSLSVQKFSPEETLIWEYSMVSFDATQFIPKGISLLNDDKIFVACYKVNDTLKKNLALYCINSEGDFQDEIIFK